MPVIYQAVCVSISPILCFVPRQTTLLTYTPGGIFVGMTTLEITSENVDQTIADNDIVLLDFWAAWCGPCRSFAPVFERASEANSDIVFGKVDTEAQQALSAEFSITSIPTLFAFREGIPVFAQPGALPAPQLDELIKAIRGLDMEEVRAQMAAHNHGDHNHA